MLLEFTRSQCAISDSQDRISSNETLKRCLERSETSRVRKQRANILICNPDWDIQRGRNLRRKNSYSEWRLTANEARNEPITTYCITSAPPLSVSRVVRNTRPASGICKPHQAQIWGQQAVISTRWRLWPKRHWSPMLQLKLKEFKYRQSSSPTSACGAPLLLDFGAQHDDLLLALG